MASFTQGLGHPFGGRRVDVGNRDAGPFLGKAFAVGLADTVSAPGYDDYPVLGPVHRFLFFQRLVEIRGRRRLGD